MESKPFYLSKVFWFNVLALIVLVANGFGFVDFQADPETTEYAAVAITLINVILRFATRVPIKL